MIGALAGVGYGVLLAGVIGFAVTDQFSPRIIAWTASTFGVAGFFFGNFALESVLALVHFLWGAANGLGENPDYDSTDSPGYLRLLALSGFSLGLALTGWWYW